MAISGEFFGGDGYCDEHKLKLPLMIMKNGRGVYFIGTKCPKCFSPAPTSRETRYFESFGDAQRAFEAIKNGDKSFFRNIDHVKDANWNIKTVRRGDDI